jgi:outer membrane immunogenic protein
MKKLLLIGLFFLTILTGSVSAQEKYGKTLNLGAGFGYYGYIGGVSPALNVNFEFDVVKNFTLAPFVSLYSYRSDSYYYYDPIYGNNYYHYHETVIPVGAKGYYYFDDLLNLPKQFDVYAAASVGFNIRIRNWDNGYYGDRGYHGPGYGSSFLYTDAHAGGEYHFNKGIGFYVDLSTGLSTVGVAFHLN